MISPMFEPGRISRVVIPADALAACPPGKQVALNADGELVDLKYSAVLAKTGQILRLSHGRNGWGLFTGYVSAQPWKAYSWDISIPTELKGLPVSANVSETGENGIPFIGDAVIYTLATMVDWTVPRIKVVGGHTYGTNLNIAAGVVITF